MIAVNRQVRLRAGFGSGVTRGDLLLHEIGHTMGLGHSASSTQLMYRTLTRSTARYGRGDLRGLELRGAEPGCMRTSSNRSAIGPEQITIDR